MKLKFKNKWFNNYGVVEEPPVSKVSFRLSYLFFLLKQLVLLAIISCFLKFVVEVYPDRILYSNVLSVVVVAMTVCLLGFDLKIIGRFKDINPDYKFPTYKKFIVLMIPSMYFLILLYLLFTDHEEKPNPNIINGKYFIRWYVPLFIIQLFFPIVSYFTASPQGYDLSKDVSLYFKIKEVNKRFSSDEKAYSEVLRTDGPNLDHHGLKLIASIENAQSAWSQSRSIAQGRNKDEAIAQRELKVLKHLCATIKIAEEMKFGIMDYSFFHWVYPPGPLLIFMTSSMKTIGINSYSKKVLSQSLGIIHRYEIEKDELNISNKEEFYAELSILKRQLTSSKTFLKNTIL